jgi:UDP-2,3-diacylglucosamine pyrophosphatase LpxH
MSKRPVEVAVISDAHLGTAACRAAELNAYLKTIEPRVLVLNGDIVDLWDFRKGFWPEAHTKVVRRILKFAVDGVAVHYITGNHDGALRRYSAMALGAISLVDRLELDLDGRRHWFLHGDAFDLSLGTGAVMGWLGTQAYDGLASLGVGVNRLRAMVGMRPMSMVDAWKRRLPAARRHIERYEDCCLRAAAARGYDAVVTGHIHVPRQRSAEIGGRRIEYLNSGDWVDSMSALEYADGAWRVVTWNGLLAEGLVRAPSLEDTVGLRPAAA